MIFVRRNGEKIDFIHYMPFDNKHGLGKTKEQLKQEGILVEQLPPKLAEAEGKTQELYFIDGQLQWKYEDVPKTQEEKENTKIAELEQKIQQQNQAIADLTVMISTLQA